MRMHMLPRLGKGAVSMLLALTLSVMMVPATAFAANDVNKVDVNANTQDVSVEVGDVSTHGNPGVKAKADNGYTATVKTGNITAEAGQGVIADADNLGTVKVKTGDIESASDNGIEARVKNQATIDITAGDIASGEYSAGIWTSVENGGIVADGTVTVKVCDVNAKGEGVVMRAYCQADITVEAGNVTARENGIELVIENGGKAALSANDITSDKSGMFVYVNEGSQIDALVTGTLSGKKAPISFFGALGNQSECLKLTVWKIALNDGAVALQANPGEGMMTQAMPEGDVPDNEIPRDFRGWIVSPFSRGEDYGTNFEKSILYIMKLDQPGEGATLSATYANGAKLETSHDYSVAKEGETVRLKVSLQEGYDLLSAFDGNGDKVELIKGEDGFYYIDYVVPKGGGIGLSVLLNGPADSIVPTEEANAAAVKATSANAGSGATLPKTGDSALPLALLPIVLFAAAALALASVRIHVREN